MPDLHQNTRQMSMRQRGRGMSLKQEHQTITTDFLQAAGLLRHDLVWSEDFDAIRLDLADYLENHSRLGAANHPALISMVKKLIATENDMSI